jgi:hypothetical protein
MIIAVDLYMYISRPVLGPAQPPIPWVLVTLSPRVKWLGRESDHPPSSSAEVKNGEAIPFTAPIRLHGVVLN